MIERTARKTAALMSGVDTPSFAKAEQNILARIVLARGLEQIPRVDSFLPRNVWSISRNMKSFLYKQLQLCTQADKTLMCTRTREEGWRSGSNSDDDECRCKEKELSSAHAFRDSETPTSSKVRGWWDSAPHHATNLLFKSTPIVDH